MALMQVQCEARCTPSTWEPDEIPAWVMPMERLQPKAKAIWKMTTRQSMVMRDQVEPAMQPSPDDRENYDFVREASRAMGSFSRGTPSEASVEEFEETSSQADSTCSWQLTASGETCPEWKEDVEC